MLHKLLTLFFFLAFAISLSAQEDKTFEIFDIEKPPSFPGGEKEMFKYLGQNIKYPALASENNVQGVVALTFLVNSDGSVSDVSVIKDIGFGCGQEATRVVKAMPKWIPGEANGKPVRVRYTLPVRFRLDDGTSTKPPSIAPVVSDEKVWDIVHQQAEETFVGKEFPKSFVLKPRQKGTREFMQSTCEIFSVNVSREDMKEITSLGALSNYIVRAQKSVEIYTEKDFGGSGQRFNTSRPSCKSEMECPSVIQSIIVPMGYIVTFYTEPDFKGDKLSIDASGLEYKCTNMSTIKTDKQVTGSKKNIDWSESVQSIKIVKRKQ